jgi:hypothetical protein
MNIPLALHSAKEWDRGRCGALYTFFTEQMVVDVEHRRRLIVEICLEIYWLSRMLKMSNPYSDGDITYTDKDMFCLKNLLEAAQMLEYQDKV